MTQWLLIFSINSTFTCSFKIRVSLWPKTPKHYPNFALISISPKNGLEINHCNYVKNHMRFSFANIKVAWDLKQECTHTLRLTVGAGLVHWDEQGTIWHNATCTLMSNGLWTVQRSLTTVIKTINYIKLYKKHIKRPKLPFPTLPNYREHIHVDMDSQKDLLYY